jgi:SAM-dependent methyltransferase
VTKPVESAFIGAHLEHPDALPRQHEFPVQGWVTSRAPLRAVVVDGSTLVTLALRHRPDVVQAMPDAPHASGFFGVARREHLSGGELALRFVFEHESVVTRFAPPPESPGALAARAARLARVYPVLRCIHCNGAFAEAGYVAGARAIRCASCGTSYDCSQGLFDLLSDEARARLALGSDAGISRNEYEPAALAFVNEHPDALILDCGAGFRNVEFPHVVNLEVVPYRSTDVLADGERLPFADASFDGVLSLAVLEHVRNPFAAAKELLRVLKPGGKLLAVVPFLQPVHAYPHHYFNMTADGLARLFEGELDVEAQLVPDSGLPIWSLSWILRSWAEGLPAPTRDAFLNLRVADLVGGGHEYLTRDFVRELPTEKNFELASTTLILGTKRGARD